MELLQVELSDGTSPPVLHVTGEVDIATAGQLRAALGEALAADPTVVVDMAGVAFIDASGLRVIVEAAASLNGAGPLTLVHAPLVARLLQLLGLDDVQSIALRDGGPAHG